MEYLIVWHFDDDPHRPLGHRPGEMVRVLRESIVTGQYPAHARLRAHQLIQKRFPGRPYTITGTVEQPQPHNPHLRVAYVRPSIVAARRFEEALSSLRP